MVHDGEPARTIAQLPASKPDAIWISHVMGLTHEHALSEAVRSQLVQIPNFARSSAGWHGLRNAYREPERLGVDRWLAMIAAWPTHRGAACVANAVTALPFHVIDAPSHHPGGILPTGPAPP